MKKNQEEKNVKKQETKQNKQTPEATDCPKSENKKSKNKEH